MRERGREVTNKKRKEEHKTEYVRQDAALPQHVRHVGPEVAIVRDARRDLHEGRHEGPVPVR